MTTIKQAQLAPKYVLKLDSLDLYVSNNQKPTGCVVTLNIKQAMQFSIGFDNEEMKSFTWTSILQKQCNNKDIKLEVIYL